MAAKGFCLLIAITVDTFVARLRGATSAKVMSYSSTDGIGSKLPVCCPFRIVGGPTMLIGEAIIANVYINLDLSINFEFSNVEVE